MASDHGHEMVAISMLGLRRLITQSGITDFTDFGHDARVLRDAMERVEGSATVVETSNPGNTTLASPPVTSSSLAVAGIPTDLILGDITASTPTNTAVVTRSPASNDSWYRLYFRHTSGISASRIDAVVTELEKVMEDCRIGPGRSVRHQHYVPEVTIAVWDGMPLYELNTDRDLMAMMMVLVNVDRTEAIDVDEAFRHLESHRGGGSHGNRYLLRCCITLAMRYLHSVIEAVTDEYARLKAVLLPLCLINQMLDDSTDVNWLWTRNTYIKLQEQIKNVSSPFVRRICRQISFCLIPDSPQMIEDHPRFFSYYKILHVANSNEEAHLVVEPAYVILTVERFDSYLIIPTAKVRWVQWNDRYKIYFDVRRWCCFGDQEVAGFGRVKAIESFSHDTGYLRCSTIRGRTIASDYGHNRERRREA